MIAPEYATVRNKSKVYYNGSVWETNKCGMCRIIGKTDWQKINNKTGEICYPYYACEFSDGTVIVTHYDAIRNGNVVNPNHRSVYGVGYIGFGVWKPTVDGKNTQEYTLWSDMLQRCYSDKFQENNPQYRGCTVEPRWHSFQNFCDDIMDLENYYAWKYIGGYELDKDLRGTGRKLYSRSTCMFLSKERNLSEMNIRRRNYYGK